MVDIIGSNIPEDLKKTTHMDILGFAKRYEKLMKDDWLFWLFVLKLWMCFFFQCRRAAIGL